MKTHPTPAEAFTRLGELINEVNIAMLTTVAADGMLRSRPMATQQIDLAEGTLWFFTASDSPKSDEILHRQQVSLAYVSVEKHYYVSVSGRAQLVRDPAKTRQLWNPAARIWFPEGPDDPKLALLRIDVTAAEYWPAPSDKMIRLLGSDQSAAGMAHKTVGENTKPEMITRDLQS